MKNLTQILHQFESISLEKLLDADLMNRVDSKFLVNFSLLPKLLEELKDHYHVLEIENQRISKYENFYFDSDDRRFYLDHHNHKNHRFKVRYRKYSSTKTTYFEIKERRKNRTIKQRFLVEQFVDDLGKKEMDLVQSVIGTKVKLYPVLVNEYHRITLASTALKERLTIDVGVTYTKGEVKKPVGDVVIVELKQEELNRMSPAFQVMNQNKIRPFRFSKYCVGSVLLFPKEEIKYNNFKYIIQKLNTYKNAI